VGARDQHALKGRVPGRHAATIAVQKERIPPIGDARITCSLFATEPGREGNVSRSLVGQIIPCPENLLLPKPECYTSTHIYYTLHRWGKKKNQPDTLVLRLLFSGLPEGVLRLLD
jgi:hypothetical protein